MYADTLIPYCETVYAYVPLQKRNPQSMISGHPCTQTIATRCIDSFL